MPKQDIYLKADHELQRQMNTTASDNHPIEAVIRLRPDDPALIVPPPEKTEQLTHQVLNRVKDHVGKPEDRFHIFQNLGYFIVSASKPFLRELLMQPEVAAAMANRQPEESAPEPIEEPDRTRPARGMKSSPSAGNPKTRPATAKARKKTF